MSKKRPNLQIDIEISNHEYDIKHNSPPMIRDVLQEKNSDRAQLNEKPPVCESVFRGKIKLNPGILPSNYYAALFQTFIAYVNLAATSTLQPLILLDPAFYDVQENEVGMVLGEIIMIQTVTKILFTPTWGYLIDKLGRRVMGVAGGIAAFLGFVMVPFQKTVIPGYALSKVLVSNGVNILLVLPFNADYVHDSTKGKATGFL